MIEQIGPIVQASKRIADRSFKHLAPKPLIRRVEPDQLEHNGRPELDTIAVSQLDQVLGRIRLPFK